MTCLTSTETVGHAYPTPSDLFRLTRRSENSPPAVLQTGMFDQEGIAGAELVQRIRHGETAAETEMVERYGPGLRLLLARLGASPSLNDDIYQGTFATVLPKVREGKVHEPAALVGFLRSTARNLLRDDRRKSDCYDHLDDEAHSPLISRGGSLATEANQLDQVLAAEEAQLARRVLDELRYDRDREVLTRYYLKGESGHEICGDLDVTPRLFNRILYRARQRLREHWNRSAKHSRQY